MAIYDLTKQQVVEYMADSESNPIIIPEKRSFWKRMFNIINNNK